MAFFVAPKAMFFLRDSAIVTTEKRHSCSIRQSASAYRTDAGSRPWDSTKCSRVPIGFPIPSLH
ncbi:hypothetical protein CKO51_18630 [Rhodopirellula sp. SM50]|nr:hypothetical protein CKO51_18630 [Rhodopirellula sp. SM50]